MVPVARRQRLIVGQSSDDGHQIGIERFPVLAFRFSLVVLPELPGPFNRPHGDRPIIPAGPCKAAIRRRSFRQEHNRDGNGHASLSRQDRLSDAAPALPLLFATDKALAWRSDCPPDSDPRPDSPDAEAAMLAGWKLSDGWRTRPIRPGDNLAAIATHGDANSRRINTRTTAACRDRLQRANIGSHLMLLPDMRLRIHCHAPQPRL